MAPSATLLPIQGTTSLIAGKALRQRAMWHPSIDRVRVPRCDQAAPKGCVNLPVEPQQGHGRQDAEVEDAAVLEDRGRVERHIQVRRGQEVTDALEL
jgi:hypothetical protein